MATPTKLDIQAVKDAMAKTPWLNYVDAARQVRWVQNPVAPITAPVAPLVPTPTVAPITNQEVQQGVNAVWGTAEQRRQTRTDITANQTIAPPVAPVSPSVTESPAPVTEKTGITQDAFQQAQAKSAEIKAQNDAVMAQNKQKSDLAREDAALAAQAAIPTDKKGIVNAMVTGASIPVQKTEAYNKAVVTSDLFKKFSWMTSDQLFQNLQQGQIGTELSGLLASNPNFAIAKQKYEQVQKTNAINTQTNAMYNAANGKENTVVDELAKIEWKYSAPPGTNAQAYEQFVTQDPDVVKSWLELKNLATQINTVTKTYNDALKSLKEQYPDMPASALITLMGTRTKDTKELLDSYISAKELAKGDFDLAMKMADGHYNAVSKDIAEQDQIEKEQRAIQAQKDMIQYEADFVKKQAEAALNDPAIAIKNVMDEYKKLGIPFTSTVQSRLAEFKASGKPLEQFLTEMWQNIQASPAYQKYQALQQGQMSDAQKIASSQAFEMNKMGLEQDFQMKLAKAKQTTDNKWTKLDDGLYTNEAGEIITADELKSAKLTNNSYISKPVGAEGGECGFYASRGTGMSATPGGNSKDARKQAFSDTTPQVGWMVFFGWDGYDKTYGHIGIVTGVNQDGTINVKDSNYGNDKLVRERTVPASTATGFYNNTPLAKSLTQGTETPIGGQYTDEQVDNLAYLVDLQEKNPSEASKQMKEMWYTAKDMASFKAGNVPLTEKQKNSSTDVMTAIADLADASKYEWNDAVWFLAWTPSMSGWDAATATMAIDNLIAKMTLPNLGVLKWPMSDKDIQFIKDASAKLSRDQSDASFERNLIDAYNIAARRAGKPEIKKLSDIKSEVSWQSTYTPESNPLWLNL